MDLQDCAVKIFKHEGFTAFWRGFGAFYSRCAPHAMIILVSREQIINMYNKTFGKEVNGNQQLTTWHLILRTKFKKDSYCLLCDTKEIVMKSF